MTELLPLYENTLRAQKRAKLIRESGHGLAIPISDHIGTFWSRGWRGCVCGQPIDDWTITLHYFRERHGPVVTQGWRCTER